MQVILLTFRLRKCGLLYLNFNAEFNELSPNFEQQQHKTEKWQKLE